VHVTVFQVDFQVIFSFTRTHVYVTFFQVDFQVFFSFTRTHVYVTISKGDFQVLFSFTCPRDFFSGDCARCSPRFRDHWYTLRGPTSAPSRAYPDKHSRQKIPKNAILRYGRPHEWAAYRTPSTLLVGPSGWVVSGVSTRNPEGGRCARP
jgi:hypothetical protein